MDVRRRLAQVRRLPIASCREGDAVRITAAITGDAPLTSPRGRACVYYEIIVERHGGGDREPRRLLHEARAVPFVVEDATGRALVDPTGAQIAIGIQPTRADEHAALRAFLDGRDRGLLPDEPGWIAAAVTIVVHELVVGERVLVLGAAVREPDPDGAVRATGYRGDAPTRLRFSASPRVPLYVSDYPDAQY